MRTVVVYESMFGSTHQVAEAVAGGLRDAFGSGADVTVRNVRDGDAAVLDGVDLVVVGGPTQAWGMSRPSTRRGAPDYTRKATSDLVLEPGADDGPGVREWLATVTTWPPFAAAFDTRVKGPPALTGRASKSVARSLDSRGCVLVIAAESFLVDRRSHLLPGELERARAWGAAVALQAAHVPAR